jgi:hypothetical protein
MLPVRLIDDRPDGARAATTSGAATKAVVDLLGIAHLIVSCIHGVPNVVVAEDIAGTDDHETRKNTFSDAASSIWDSANVRWRLQQGGND